MFEQQQAEERDRMLIACANTRTQLAMARIFINEAYHEAPSGLLREDTNQKLREVCLALEAAEMALSHDIKMLAEIANNAMRLSTPEML